MHVTQLKDAFSRFITGVTVVTTRFEGQDFGMTCNSFNTVSLDPALVMWSIRKTAGSYGAFTQAAGYAVNILAADQSDIAIGFAKGTQAERFALLDVQHSPSGLKIVPKAAAWLDCQLIQIVSAGDHDILIGKVTAVNTIDAPALGYAQRQFGVIKAINLKT